MYINGNIGNVSDMVSLRYSKLTEFYLGNFPLLNQFAGYVVNFFLLHVKNIVRIQATILLALPPLAFVLVRLIMRPIVYSL